MTETSKELKALRRLHHDLITVKAALKTSMGFLLAGAAKGGHREAHAVACDALDRLQAIIDDADAATAGQE